MKQALAGVETQSMELPMVFGNEQAPRTMHARTSTPDVRKAHSELSLGHTQRKQSVRGLQRAGAGPRTPVDEVPGRRQQQRARRSPSRE